MENKKWVEDKAIRELTGGNWEILMKRVGKVGLGGLETLVIMVTQCNVLPLITWRGGGFWKFFLMNVEITSNGKPRKIED